MNSEAIKKAAQLIHEADSLFIGTGAGREAMIVRL